MVDVRVSTLQPTAAGGGCAVAAASACDGPRHRG
jgi:hypothetical protein